MALCRCGCGEKVSGVFVHGHNRRGVACSPQTLAKRHAAWGATSPMKGKRHSPETRARMSATPRKARGEMPAPQRAKIGAALRGRPSPLRIHPIGQPRDRREYDANNSERKAQRTRDWALKHPERRQVNEAKRRAQKRGTGGNGVTHEQWATLREEYGHRCAYCAEFSPLELDHIEPLSKGGVHDVSNVAPSCQTCNSSKHNRSIVVWLARRAA